MREGALKFARSHFPHMGDTWEPRRVLMIFSFLYNKKMHTCAHACARTHAHACASVCRGLEWAAQRMQYTISFTCWTTSIYFMSLYCHCQYLQRGQRLANIRLFFKFLVPGAKFSSHKVYNSGTKSVPKDVKLSLF